MTAGLRVLARPQFLRTPVAQFAAAATPSLAVLLACAARDAGVVEQLERDEPVRVRRLARDLRWDRVVPDLGPRLVNLVLERTGALSALTSYNLACYYAPRDRRKALHHLRHVAPALDDEQIEWARKDPSFRPIREDVRNICAEEMTRRERVTAAATPVPSPPEPPRPQPVST